MMLGIKGRLNWFLLLGAPLSVVLSLLLLQNVFVVFAVYHLGFCLLLPAALNLVFLKKSWPDHLKDLGLRGPGTTHGIFQGLAWAAVGSAGLLVAYKFLGAAFLQNNQVTDTLTAWGAGPEKTYLVAAILVLLNGPAEELYWRGYLPTRLAGGMSTRGVTVIISACYASYHGVTVFLFLNAIIPAILVLVGIFAAGLFWAHLREKSRSVWPPLLSHTAITAAYVWIWLQLG